MKERASIKKNLKKEDGQSIEVRYAIVSEEVPAGHFMCERYGIQLETDTGEQALFQGVTTSRTRIEELYGLLHRNGVTPLTLRDVLEDWL